MKHVTLILIASAGVALAGCSKPQTAGQRDAVWHSPAGDIALAHDAAPTNLPAYAPAYPGARWTQTIKMGTGGIATFITPDKAATVIDFYDQAAAKAGLTNKIRVPVDAQGGSGMMVSQAGTQRSLTVTASPNVGEQQPGMKVSLAYGTP